MTNAQQAPFTPIDPTKLADVDDVEAHDTWEPILPVPDDAPPASSQTHPLLGKPTATWAYTDIQGRTLLHVARFDPPPGSTQRRKEFHPLTYCRTRSGGREWRWRGLGNKPRPLFNLQKLADRHDAPVLVVEGEKKAVAAEHRFPEMVVTCSMNGAEAAGKTDWTPLKGRDAAVWPDHDDAGEGYAADVCEQLRRVGAASVKVVSVPDSFPPKWDLADDLPPGVTSETLRAMLADAKAPAPQERRNDPKTTTKKTAGTELLFNQALIGSDSRRLMFHRGADTANAVHLLCAAADGPDVRDARAAHPWYADLRNYVHLGWAADGVDRTDWSEVEQLPPDVELVFVADKDGESIDEVARISRYLKRSMSVVRFTDRFPPGFNLAQPWPTHERWWSSKGRYTGPTRDDLKSPATWATDVVKPKIGPSTRKARLNFANEWYYVVQPSAFVHRRRPDRMYSAAEFNALVRPFSDADQTDRLLVRCGGSQVDGVAYLPGDGLGVVTHEGRRVIQTWRPSDVEPTAGKPRPWLDFMEHLVPDPTDRHHLMRWVATLAASPSTRMHYSVLLYSCEQGVGKSTLGNVLARLVGTWNTSFPSEGEIVNNDFNTWVAHKRLAVINEIYAGNSSRAYNKTKEVITDDKVTVRRKFWDNYAVDNFLHVLACSNSDHALKLADNDRRWFVPGVTEELQPNEYWTGFYRWLNDGGLGVIARWAEEYVAEHGAVRKGERPPDSAAKENMVAAGRSSGAQMALDDGQAAMALAGERKVVLLLDDVHRSVAERRELSSNDHRMERTGTIARCLRQAGMHEMPRGRDPRVKLPKVGKRHVFANFELTGNETWTAHLQEHYLLNPIDLYNNLSDYRPALDDSVVELEPFRDSARRKAAGPKFT